MLRPATWVARLPSTAYLLGGVEEYRFPEHDPVFVTLRVGESELGIGALSDAPVHSRPQRPASGHRIELRVYVGDVDATVDAARAVDVPVVLEPVDQLSGSSALRTSRTRTGTS